MKNKLIEYYLMFTEPEREFTLTPLKLSRRVQDNLLSVIQELYEETQYLNSIEEEKEQKKDKIRIKKRELYQEKNSKAFEIWVYIAESRKPNIRYFVIIDDRGYHIAEIDNNYVQTSLSKDAKTKETFKKVVAHDFQQKLEKLLEN